MPALGCETEGVQKVNRPNHTNESVEKPRYDYSRNLQMKRDCPECRAIAAEMKAALAAAEEHPYAKGVSRDLRNRLMEPYSPSYSSEEYFDQQVRSGWDSRLGRAHARWAAHRAFTGHKGWEAL